MPTSIYFRTDHVAFTMYPQLLRIPWPQWPLSLFVILGLTDFQLGASTPGTVKTPRA